MDKASHIFKHLQDSPRCRALCSSECFVVIDQATTPTQLKIKEAVHTAISIYVVGSKLQTYATRPNGSMGRSRRLLHVSNTNEV